MGQGKVAGPSDHAGNPTAARALLSTRLHNQEMYAHAIDSESMRNVPVSASRLGRCGTPSRINHSRHATIAIEG